MDGEGPTDEEEVPGSWVAVTGEGRPRDPNDVVSAPPQVAPLGPRVDPTFPSLPSADPPVELAPVDREMAAVGEPPDVAAVPLARNIFTLTPIPSGLTRQDLVEEQARLSVDPVDHRLSAFDTPEKERVHAIVTTFVDGHVRRIATGGSIRKAHRHFDVGTIVISEDSVPGSGLRHAKLQWAVSSGRIVALQNARLPSTHLEPIATGPRPPYRSLHQGDDSDLAFLLAYLCDLVDLTPSVTVAATGTIALEQNQVLRSSDVDSLLDGAKHDHMSQVILPFRDGKLNGVHEGVRYWGVRDSNEAVVSFCAALADEVVVPNLHRRMVTKQAYAWASLIFILLAVCGYQLAIAFGSHPPVTFERYLLYTVALFLVGSVVCTHRFWRLDR